MRALADWHKETSGNRAPMVWLPGYFCNQSTWPLRDCGAEPVFYPVTKELEPDWERCRALADRARPDLFVLVHYFGRAGNVAAARAFCDETDALLVEDAAHAALPADGIGEAGDFVFHCPHKILPVPDGAVLLARVDEALPALKQAARGPAPPPLSWLARRLIRKLGLAGTPDKTFADDPDFAPLPRTPGLSSAARRLIARASEELQETTRARADNARMLAARLADGDCQTLFEDMSQPYRLVLGCGDMAAAGRFEALMREGLWVETWPDLAPEVKAAPETHAAALALRSQLLFVAVHQTP